MRNRGGVDNGLARVDRARVASPKGDGFFLILEIELGEVVLDHELHEFFEFADIDHGVFRGVRSVDGRERAPDT